MASGGVMYIPNVINIGLGLRKLLGRIHMRAHTQQDDLIRLHVLFHTMYSGQEISLHICILPLTAF